MLKSDYKCMSLIGGITVRLDSNRMVIIDGDHEVVLPLRVVRALYDLRVWFADAVDEGK